MLSIAHAQAHTEAARSLLAKIEAAIIFPLVTLLMAIALLVFLWGAFRFIASAGDEGARAIGKRHMLFGVIGMLIMLSAVAILRVAAGTFGLDVPQ